MCGIAAIIYKNETNTEQNNGSEIEFLKNCLLHRGPDNQSVSIHQNVHLAHNRLAIIDLSADANQPFHYKNELSIVFNGAIYNYLEIKQKLIQLGYTFTTNSDTEVLLLAYHAYGEDCVQHFNGMWSFVIYNHLSNIVFCSRDRFGVKPFYYYEDDTSIIISSEVVPIAKLKNINQVNQKVIVDFLTLNYLDHHENTFFKGIQRLMPGHHLVYDINNKTTVIKKYYEIKYIKEIAELSFDEAQIQLQQLLNNAIELRTRADVPLGLSLSGGVDSSYIANELSGLKKKKEISLKAISIGSLFDEVDDAKNAKMVSQYLHIDYTEEYPNKIDFENHLLEVVRSQGEPFGSLSIYMQFFLMKKTKQENLKVIIGGQGADELLLGYISYIGISIFHKNISQFYGFIKDFFRNIDDKKMVFFSFLISSFYWLRLLVIHKKYSFLKKEILNNIDYQLTKKLSNSYRNNLFEFQKTEITQTILPSLLRYEDRNAMHFAIESRLPFLDYRVVEFCLSLPVKYKLKKGWTKYILRCMLDGFIPNSITWRKRKIGFDAPDKVWLHHHEKEIEDAIQSSSILKNIMKDQSKYNENHMWKLYNIALWEKEFNMKW